MLKPLPMGQPLAIWTRWIESNSESIPACHPGAFPHLSRSLGQVRTGKSQRPSTESVTATLFQEPWSRRLSTRLRSHKESSCRGTALPADLLQLPRALVPWNKGDTWLMQSMQMLQNHTKQRKNCVNFLLFRLKDRDARGMTKHGSNCGTGFDLMGSLACIQLRTAHA